MSSIPGDMTASCRAYLDALFSRAPHDSLVELRTRARRGMTCKYWPAPALDEAARHIHDCSVDTDVYVGVLPRTRLGGTRSDLAREGAVLWVDCDSPQSTRALALFTPRPSMTVASGTAGNVHAYWLLRHAVSLDDIERANRALAHQLDADAMCADAARILRPPSLNHKHAPPKSVRLLDCDPLRRWSLEEVVQLVRTVDNSSVSRALDDNNELLQLDPAMYIEVLSGLAVGRDRKIACPFHDDRTPSLHAYRTGARGWYCFGCGRGGSIYDFAALLWQLDTRGADFVALRDRLATTFAS